MVYQAPFHTFIILKRPLIRIIQFNFNVTNNLKKKQFRPEQQKKELGEKKTEKFYLRKMEYVVNII